MGEITEIFCLIMKILLAIAYSSYIYLTYRMYFVHKLKYSIEDFKIMTLIVVAGYLMIFCIELMTKNFEVFK